MAFQIRKIDPLDLQPRKAIGVSIPFSSKSVFNSTYQTKDAIKTNLINYLLTGVGERYFNPTFGTPLRKQLFENITQEKITFISELIKDGLQLYFPNILVSELRLEGTPDQNLITLYLKYSILNTNIVDQIITIVVEQ